MRLKAIVENSNYVTDEELIDSNILGIANTCLAEVNRACGTLLPFFTDIDLTDDKNYNAIPETWVLALLEPYFSYSIAANDGDSDNRTFHYNRFLGALADFKAKGMSTISERQYKNEADSKQRSIDVSDVTVRWGWF